MAAQATMMTIHLDPKNRPRIKNLVVLVINLQLAIMSAEGTAKKSRQSAESRRPASRHSESRG